ncbi:MAG: galactose-1-epimerase, partial [Opitutales bacterium]|nr:galactose-1-epimerase [Opitutales bacterium]
YKHRFGFCLETQVYPDSPNQKSFPNAVLRPGETYTHHCTYKFSVAK